MFRGLCTYCSAPLPNFLHSPEPEQVNRGIHLGYLSDDNEFRIPLSHFGYHFAFYGATGSGKTREAMKLAIEAENSGLKLLLLDVEGEWKNIIPLLKNKTEYYATDVNLKINPYDLNDYGLVRALLKETIFKGIEVEYQDLSPQMNYVLDNCIRNSNSMPTLIDNVMSYEEENLPFKLVNLDKTKTALLVRLEPYKSNPALNEIFYTESSSINLEKLDDRNIIIDLHSLEARVAYRIELRLIYNAIAIAYLKLALQREPTDTIANLFIADEAQLLAPKILKKLVVTDTWATTEFATRLRKRGQSIAIISQSPSSIEDDIRKNCQNVFVFRLQDAKDVELIARSTGYNWYTALDYFTQELTNLKQKQALVKTPLVSEPFIITSANVTFNPVNAVELRRYSPQVPIESLHLPETKPNIQSSLEMLFLESIEKHPFISTRERRHLLHWDDKTYSKVVERLVSANKIEKVGAKTGRGAPRVLYQIVGKNPSVKHEFYVHLISEALRTKGIDCTISREGPDIQVPSLSTAINVETGNSDVEGNIKIALNKFTKVIVCSDDEKVIQKIVQQNKDERILCSLCWEVPSLFGG
jgi:hypothetical protein